MFINFRYFNSIQMYIQNKLIISLLIIKFNNYTFIGIVIKIDVYTQ